MSLRPALRRSWPGVAAAAAFWTQDELRPYRKLVADTLDWAAPADGETWLDLGCGRGQLTRALWERANGTLAGVVGLDHVAVYERAYDHLRTSLTPSPGEQVRFVCHDFTTGLGLFPDDTFDHAVSGLALAFAESFDLQKEAWTDEAYDAVLAETWRVIRPGGRFVFSVYAPRPFWWLVAAVALGDLIECGRPLGRMAQAWRIRRYGAWLNAQAAAGRFHFLAADVVTAKVTRAGFERVESRTSYAGQALVVRGFKPGGEVGSTP